MADLSKILARDAMQMIHCLDQLHSEVLDFIMENGNDGAAMLNHLVVGLTKKQATGSRMVGKLAQIGLLEVLRQTSPYGDR